MLKKVHFSRCFCYIGVTSSEHTKGISFFSAFKTGVSCFAAKTGIPSLIRIVSGYIVRRSIIFERTRFGEVKCLVMTGNPVKEEKGRLMTENAVMSASTCRLKRPGYLVLLSPLKVDERRLNQELEIFEKSIGDESVPPPSTLFTSCSVLSNSSQSNCCASLHGLNSGNVSWKKESNMKELKMESVRSWLSCNPNSEEFASAEGDDRVVSSVG